MAKGNSNSLALSIPIFTGEKYDIWSIKMKTYFLSQNLWNIVNEPKNTSTLSESDHDQQQQKQQNDASALFILQQAVDDYIFPKVSAAKTAKEAWDALKKEYQGNIPQTIALQPQDMEVCKKYLPLYQAILKSDLEKVKNLCDEDKKALEAKITVKSDTALHVAVGTGKANIHIVEYLLNKMSMHQVSLKNRDGDTVLSVAAIVDNLPAANMILKRDQYKSLIQESNNYKRIPLIEAARHGQKKMVQYLEQFSKDYLKYVSATRFEDKSGVSFINMLITAGFYDLALDLLQKLERSLDKKKSSYGQLLSTIAGKPSSFPSGRQRKIKSWQYFNFPKLTSHIKEKGESELMKLLELVKFLCKAIAKDIDHENTYSLLKQPLHLAVELGICEVVEEIINSCPDAIWFTNEKNQNIFHLAVIKRQEKVFHHLYKMTGRKHLLLMSEDVDKNNILHLAGKLAPKNQLNLIPSAALQMQRELQWYEEVDEIIPPDYKEEKNYKGETPAMVFTEEHKELVKEGEKWMKDAATSCSIAAALVATVVFAAAISVPGSYNSDGQPNFHKLTSFTIFGISDAFSLFSSIAAIIMFLSVLTARYAEHDFLYSLPNRLIWGLVMLFLSLTSLMVAFCATVYLVFSEKKEYWILALVFAAALVPLSLFLYSQYPLLRDVLKSTYRRDIFCKKRRRVSAHFLRVIRE